VPPPGGGELGRSTYAVGVAAAGITKELRIEVAVPASRADVVDASSPAGNSFRVALEQRLRELMLNLGLPLETTIGVPSDANGADGADSQASSCKRSSSRSTGWSCPR
jgi:hypothetical protein